MPNKDHDIQLENQRKHYRNNKQSYKERNARRRERRRQWLQTVLANLKCQICSEDAFECLDFHHVNPNDKDDEVCRLLNSFRSMYKVIKEMEKCVTVCANCHRKVHRGTIKIENAELAKVPEHLRDPKLFRL